MKAEYDFSKARRARDVPHLAKLQAESRVKERVTMRLDGTTVAAFKARAAATGGSYQTLINDALREYLAGHNLANIVREAAEQAARKGAREALRKRPATGR